MRVVPRVSFTESHFLFGFWGVEGCPIPKRIENKFVEVGDRKRQAPGETDGHYIDHKGAYHIQSEQRRAKHKVKALGFVVQTRAPGEYPARVVFDNDYCDGAPRHPLTLKVGLAKSREVECYQHKKCLVLSDAALVNDEVPSSATNNAGSP